MDKKAGLLTQIEIVIALLEKQCFIEIKSGVLQLIYERYKKALIALEKENSINNLNIAGGVRAYMDSYSDYNNPLLEEMHKAEKLYGKLI
ncbi:hypothetical protein KO561_16645 [Radiobacillus kanasensis]|uniref:hypothetical protein n=1 Tax=Radiobacillus kanasensis TaxID=2844358 RepID=UPI001E3ED3BD|nr:hypothetical protein [Radiobacillus kanasensis]UFT98804.1 hypothetical protein KO561_16645 [Radiobacillus kanasensis]